ncbi:hypothetical protein, conserved [Trypanosoma brucei gambiense DAL972]|uniref:Uncharacterized protein n=2 Tax=Trypanosoma brucei TaxID=5691 RepID=D0A6C4_TRYB9|nr:hypothetical protein, conserved [Trypanosoma brucei gambiense DAL972]RHW68290.1 Proteasome maturation protein 13 [Trypanosoma brucei equiperdum]CBH17225.1 hypothetical protein, conserved [Trypanosoma brucei gambiense DAL972]|eukprot:XP_011779489.1 hypothetical protein, conserved [Trypanosoma brucei gambiense DAL972]
MTALSNGSFIFTAGRGRELHLLEKGSDQKSYIVYGGEVLAFACCEEDHVIAIGLRSQSGPDQCVIRIYQFNGSEVGDMLAEASCLKVTQLMWIESRQLMACGPAGCSLFVWKKNLSVSFKDSAVGCFMQIGRVALLYSEFQTIKYWSFDTKKMLAAVKLPQRDHRVLTVASAGYFCFALYEDGTVQAFYVTRSTVKKLEVFKKLFPMLSTNGAVGGTSAQLLLCALSSRKVLVGLRGGGRVHKLEYKNDKVLVDSLQEDLPTPFALMGISLDGRRCLVLDTKEGRHCTLVLSFGGTKELSPGTEARSVQKKLPPAEKTRRTGGDRGPGKVKWPGSYRVSSVLVATGVVVVLSALVIRRFSSR